MKDNNSNISITNNPQSISEQKITDYTKNGSCSHCGACCPDNLRISEDEVDRIKKYIKDNNIKPCNHTPVLMANAVDFLCPFLDTNKETEKCRIYEVRPAICKCFTCADKLENVFDKASKRDKINLINALYGKNNKASQRNLWQTFYPNAFTPKKGDIVVANKVNPTFYEAHMGVSFVVASEPINGKIHIECPDMPLYKLECDMSLVTKVINPTPRKR